MADREMRYPANDRELLESIDEWLEGLRSEDPEDVILVEGKKDINALRSLGIVHIIIPVNKGLNTFDLVEMISRGEVGEMGGPLKGRIIILTDWDRKGGFLASRARKACLHLDVPFELDHRKEIAFLLSKWIHDIESIPSLMDGLDV